MRALLQWIAGTGNDRDRTQGGASVRLSHLSLVNFRNYARLELDLTGALIVLQGDNAEGKTNLLEAIYLLATSRSPSAGTDRELLNWLVEGEIQPYARVHGDIERRDESHQLEVTVFQAEPPAQPGDLPLRKRIRVDGVPRKAMDLLGQLNVVLFLPQDVGLVAGSPSIRRRYLDVTLCQIDPRYCRTLQQYNQVVTQRNSLLRQVRDRQANRDELRFWDEQLTTAGGAILQRRLQATAELDSHARSIHSDLTGACEHLVLSYWSSVPLKEAVGASAALLATVPSAAELTERFRAHLQRAFPEEVAQGKSLAGPHRDDLRFHANGRDLRVYGSRGQQRTAALSLKLAEVRMVRGAVGEDPILLLDDVMSELDLRRRAFLMKAAIEAQQAIVTTTDFRLLPSAVLERASLFRVSQGRVTPVPGGQPTEESS